MKEILRSFNPATGEIVGETYITEIDEIKGIIEKSRKAQEKWAELSVDERIAALERAGMFLEKKTEEISRLLSHEMGKGYRESYGEVAGCAGSISYVADRVREAIEPVMIDYGSCTAEIQYLPKGVCAIIAPWNYPVSMAHWMIVPALTAGNSIILKPSEETPLVAEKYVEAMGSALPDGLIQIVQGGVDVSKALVSSKIDLIGFTGSMEAGKDILKNAAENLTPCIMELGGKDPLIVLPDADIQNAASFAVSNALANSGQMCISTERIYVHEDIYEEFNKVCSMFMRYFRMGPCDVPQANIGPMINERQREKVISHIDDAIEKGAKLIYGGKDHPDRFVRPTLLSDCTDDMLIFRDETFGPVVCIASFKTTEEAIERANDSSYGLGAVVFGKKDAEYVAARLDAGMVGINGGSMGGVDTPWTGTKGSAYGYHGSPDGHRQFTKVKVVARNE